MQALMIPDVMRPETLEMNGELQLQAVREAVLPFLTKSGLAHFCRVDLWRNHPAVKEALLQGEHLILYWPNGIVTLLDAMSEAILSTIPRPKARMRAQYFKHKRAQRMRGDA